ncbi:conserved hypothetical Ustilaginaceae-specific protein [Sporisorium reilianum SRZ2]|uniref:Conserved hypothetical Ustilaginaceae-specific protein n=1 Tax=Sporisorium reilianum (strain SRZ2) TaxID=999809 RepID=E6ZZM1_SPORE|nr:conserved hypothetical Ustilaginaceae-specific protein [Sporisorium reilianum SRZ2]
MTSTLMILMLGMASVGLHFVTAVPMEPDGHPNWLGYPPSRQPLRGSPQDLSQDLQSGTLPFTSSSTSQPGFYPTASQPPASGSSLSKAAAIPGASGRDPSNSEVWHSWEPSSMERFQSVSPLRMNDGKTVLFRNMNDDANGQVRQRIQEIFGPKLKWASSDEMQASFSDPWSKNLWPFRRTSRRLPIDGVESPNKSKLDIHITSHGNTAKRRRSAQGATILDKNFFAVWGIPRTIARKNEAVLYGAAYVDPADVGEVDGSIQEFLNKALADAQHAPR